jgi:hypothetical protein
MMMKKKETMIIAMLFLGILFSMCIAIAAPPIKPARTIVTSVLRGKLISWSNDGESCGGWKLTITLDTGQGADPQHPSLVTRSFWVDSSKIGIFTNDLQIAMGNGTRVELRYHIDPTKTPHLVLDEVKNIT